MPIYTSRTKPNQPSYIKRLRPEASDYKNRDTVTANYSIRSVVSSIFNKGRLVLQLWKWKEMKLKWKECKFSWRAMRGTNYENREKVN